MEKASSGSTTRTDLGGLEALATGERRRSFRRPRSLNALDDNSNGDVEEEALGVDTILGLVVMGAGKGDLVHLPVVSGRTMTRPLAGVITPCVPTVYPVRIVSGQAPYPPCVPTRTLHHMRRLAHMQTCCS